MIEFLTQMTALDLLFIVLWIAIILFGISTGIIRQLIVLGAILMGMIVGSLVAVPASQGTGIVSGLGAQRALPFTYSFIVIAVAVVVYILAHQSYPHTRLARRERTDRIGGALLGFVVGLITITELVAMLLFMTDGQWAVLEGTRASVRAQIQTTPFLPLVASTFPFAQSLVDALLPAH